MPTSTWTGETVSHADIRIKNSAVGNPNGENHMKRAQLSSGSDSILCASAQEENQN